MTMLSLNTLIFPGLAPGADVGVIYDIPDPTSNVSTQVPLGTILQVNATYFDVSCGSLSGSVQNVDGAPEFVFGTELGLGNTTVTDFPNTICGYLNISYVRNADGSLQRNIVWSLDLHLGVQSLMMIRCESSLQAAC